MPDKRAVHLPPPRSRTHRPGRRAVPVSPHRSLSLVAPASCAPLRLPPSRTKNTVFSRSRHGAQPQSHCSATGGGRRSGSGTTLPVRHVRLLDGESPLPCIINAISVQLERGGRGGRGGGWASHSRSRLLTHAMRLSCPGAKGAFLDHYWQRRVTETLRAHPDGLTLRQVADNVGLSSAGAWPALDELCRAGVVSESRRRIEERPRARYVSIWRLRSP